MAYEESASGADGSGAEAMQEFLLEQDLPSPAQAVRAAYADGAQRDELSSAAPPDFEIMALADGAETEFLSEQDLLRPTRSPLRIRRPLETRSLQTAVAAGAALGLVGMWATLNLLPARQVAAPAQIVDSSRPAAVSV